MDWRLLTRKDITGWALAAVIVGVLLLAFVEFPPSRQAGFGPDWNCTYPGKGDPICTKKP